MTNIGNGNVDIEWNASYQAPCDKVKSLIKEEAFMKFYGEMKLLCLETDASSVGLGATTSKRKCKLS